MTMNITDLSFEWQLEDYVKNYPDVKVIAWMSLPEPYKAESEDEDVEYQRQIEQLEHDILYEPTFNPEDGSM